MERFILPVLVVCFSALELYAVNSRLLPYYAGFTAHASHGSVPALNISQLRNGGAVELFQRLSAGKASVISAELLFVLWLLFVLAILAQVAASFLPPSRNLSSQEVPIHSPAIRP